MTRVAPTVIDLFCGAGGLSLGFRAAGCTILAGVDNDPAAARSFEDNFARVQPDHPPPVITGFKVAEPQAALPWDGPSPDILIGGPPCQGFSRIGRAKLRSLHPGSLEDDPRNRLYHSFLDSVRTWRPKAILMENVPGMMDVGGRNVADLAADEISACGYVVGYAILNAVWYGVPQFRERLFFLALREDLGLIPSMPEPTHRVALPAGYLRRRSGGSLRLSIVKHYELPVSLLTANTDAVTVSQAIDDLPVRKDHLECPSRREDLNRSLPYRHRPTSQFARLMRHWPELPASEVVTQHYIRHTPRDYETFGRMRPGDCYPDALAIANQIANEHASDQIAPETASYRPSREAVARRSVPPYSAKGFRQKWRKLIPDRPSWTLPAHLQKDSYSHIHYDSDQKRAISVREAARLQSFPDAFTFAGNMGDAYRQIGNAVPPVLAWAISAALLGQLGILARRPWAELA